MNSLDLPGRQTCEALVITCSDFRFKSAERTFAEQAGLGDDYDLIARPGGIRSLAAPRSDAAAQTMMEEIALLWSLHEFRRVLMVNHLSCRAYDDIATEENEQAVHVEHLRRAREVLAGRLAGVVVEGYVVEITGTGFVARRVE
jgi:hypothetical protein